MSRIGAFGLRQIYAAAICLYPPRFRDEYAPAMTRALEDCLADGTLSRTSLVCLLFFDLLKSLVKEHIAMVSDTFSRPVLAFNALVLAGVATILSLFLYAIPQQVLRQDANDPQLQLAGDLAARLENGIAPVDAIPAAKIDMARSLSPFVIVYDDRGMPLASQAQLNGDTPAPPQGVFDFVREHGEERVSWQPVRDRVHGVRIAAVVQRVPRMNGGAGFVLAGRSLAEVEARESQVQQMTGAAWIAMLCLIAAGTILAGWFTRRAAARTAS